MVTMYVLVRIIILSQTGRICQTTRAQLIANYETNTIQSSHSMRLLLSQYVSLIELHVFIFLRLVSYYAQTRLREKCDNKRFARTIHISSCANHFLHALTNTFSWGRSELTDRNVELYPQFFLELITTQLRFYMVSPQFSLLNKHSYTSESSNRMVDSHQLSNEKPIVSVIHIFFSFFYNELATSKINTSSLTTLKSLIPTYNSISSYKQSSIDFCNVLSSKLIIVHLSTKVCQKQRLIVLFWCAFLERRKGRCWKYYTFCTCKFTKIGMSPKYTKDMYHLYLYYLRVTGAISSRSTGHGIGVLVLD